MMTRAQIEKEAAYFIAKLLIEEADSSKEWMVNGEVSRYVFNIYKKANEIESLTGEALSAENFINLIFQGLSPWSQIANKVWFVLRHVEEMDIIKIGEGIEHVSAAMEAYELSLAVSEGSGVKSKSKSL